MSLQLTEKDVSDRPEWLSAPVCVTSNVERIFPQFEVAQNFPKFKGVPIITWYSKPKDEYTSRYITNLSGCSEAVYENTDHDLLGFFVLGLPCYITGAKHGIENSGEERATWIV
jgi:hypothetical protein